MVSREVVVRVSVSMRERPPQHLSVPLNVSVNSLPLSRSFGVVANDRADTQLVPQPNEPETTSIDNACWHPPSRQHIDDLLPSLFGVLIFTQWSAETRAMYHSVNRKNRAKYSAKVQSTFRWCGHDWWPLCPPQRRPPPLNRRTERRESWRSPFLQIRLLCRDIWQHKSTIAATANIGPLSPPTPLQNIISSASAKFCLRSSSFRP